MVTNTLIENHSLFFLAIIPEKSSDWQVREEKGGIDYKLIGRANKSQR